MNIAALPLCASNLKFKKIKMTDLHMTPFWAAVCIAEDFKDRSLREFGGFDFNDTSDENGVRQLTRLEHFMASRKRKNAPKKAAEDDKNNVQAFLGSQGIKTSELQSVGDFWLVASILWPEQISKMTIIDFPCLRAAIQSMSKKDRSYFAKSNRSKVPEKYLSTASKFTK